MASNSNSVVEEGGQDGRRQLLGRPRDAHYLHNSRVVIKEHTTDVVSLVDVYVLVIVACATTPAHSDALVQPRNKRSSSSFTTQVSLLTLTRCESNNNLRIMYPLFYRTAYIISLVVEDFTAENIFIINKITFIFQYTITHRIQCYLKEIWVVRVRNRPRYWTPNDFTPMEIRGCFGLRWIR